MNAMAGRMGHESNYTTSNNTTTCVTPQETLHGNAHIPRSTH